jgi:hypothetical protein
VVRQKRATESGRLGIRGGEVTTLSGGDFVERFVVWWLRVGHYLKIIEENDDIVQPLGEGVPAWLLLRRQALLDLIDSGINLFQAEALLESISG